MVGKMLLSACLLVLSCALAYVIRDATPNPFSIWLLSASLATLAFGIFALVSALGDL